MCDVSVNWVGARGSFTSGSHDSFMLNHLLLLSGILLHLSVAQALATIDRKYLVQPVIPHTLCPDAESVNE